MAEGVTGVVTREQLELAIWQTTGARHVEAVDKLLGMIDTYAGGGRAHAAGESPGVVGPMLGMVTGHPPLSTENLEELQMKTGEGGGDDDLGSVFDDFDRIMREVRAEGLPRPVDDDEVYGEEGQVCTLCEVWKEFDEYARDNTRPLGRRRRCKECVNTARTRGKRDRAGK